MNRSNGLRSSRPLLLTSSDVALRTTVAQWLLGIAFAAVSVLSSSACYASLSEMESIESGGFPSNTEPIPPQLSQLSNQSTLPSVGLSPSPQVQTAEDCEGSTALVLVERESRLRAKPDPYGYEFARVSPGTVLAVDRSEGAYWSLRSQGRRVFLPVGDTPKSCRTGYQELALLARSSTPLLARSLRDSLVVDIARFLRGDSVWIATTIETVRVGPSRDAGMVQVLERGRLISGTEVDEGWRAVKLVADMKFDLGLKTLAPVFESGWVRCSSLSDSATVPLSSIDREQLRVMREEARWTSMLEEMDREAQRQDEARRQRATSLWGKAIASRIMNGEIWLGMTSEMASESAGTPVDINTSVGAWGRHEQWIYERPELYLYFENGVLTSWQN